MTLIVKLVWTVTGDRMAQASTDEKNLIAYLFEQQEYNTLIRPVRNRSDTLEVKFEMALVQLITLVRHIHVIQPMKYELRCGVVCHNDESTS